MKRAAVSFSIVLGLGVLAVGEYPAGLATSLLAADAHAYFNALVANAAHWKSYSLRSQQQLDKYKQSSSAAPGVTYDPDSDTFTKPQDAAKVTVPAFQVNSALASSIDNNDTAVTVTYRNSNYGTNNHIRVDSEIMKIQSVSGSTLTVTRGAFGTAPTAHTAGARVGINNYSLLNQVWLPMGTADGHTYVTTWDAWYSKELQRQSSGLSSWKNYQFRRMVSSGPAIWFEVRTRFDLGGGTDIGAVDVRGYGGLGPNVTKDLPLSPQAGTFLIKPETWTRYWMQIEQRANAWDLMTLWVADETRGPVKMIDRLEMESANSGNATVHSFQLEFNTSTTRMTVLHDDLIAYVRNVVMLQDYGDPSNLLVRPVPGATPAARPGAPKNVRILGS